MQNFSCWNFSIPTKTLDISATKIWSLESLCNTMGQRYGNDNITYEGCGPDTLHYTNIQYTCGWGVRVQQAVRYRMCRTDAHSNQCCEILAFHCSEFGSGSNLAKCSGSGFYWRFYFHETLKLRKLLHRFWRFVTYRYSTTVHSKALLCKSGHTDQTHHI